LIKQGSILSTDIEKQTSTNATKSTTAAKARPAATSAKSASSKAKARPAATKPTAATKAKPAATKAKPAAAAAKTPKKPAPAKKPTNAEESAKPEAAEDEKVHVLDKMIDFTYLATTSIPLGGKYVKKIFDQYETKEHAKSFSHRFFQPFFPFPKVKK